MIDAREIKEQSILSTFQSIVKLKECTRAEISALIGRSVVTVCKTVDLLLKHNLLIEQKTATSVMGRKASSLCVNPTAFTILILDITKKRFSARLIDLNYQDAKEKLKYAYDDRMPLFENLEAFYKQSLAHFGEDVLTNQSCIGIGVVVPGPYLKNEDRVVNKRLPALSEVRLMELTQSVFAGKAILIEEDVKLAGLNNTLNNRTESSLTFYAYIDEGVGGSITKNGVIEPGAYSFAGDFGQMRFADGTTVEEEVSIVRFLERAGIGLVQSTPLETVFGEIDFEVPEVREACVHMEKSVALALYNVCWIIDPAYVVIESLYCKYIPDFVAHVGSELRQLFGASRGTLLPTVLPSESDVQHAYKGAASELLKQFLISL